jgi:plasmid stabilization system protein ParE
MSGKRGKPLPVVYSNTALRELDSVWNWNERTYGRRHAAQYVDFLEQHIDALGEASETGRMLNQRTDLRYIQIRRKGRGHGHIAVYQINQDVIHILHIFHTAQDWQTKLADEEPNR